MMIPNDLESDPKACSMDAFKDRGDDSNVLYDIATTPSGVYDMFESMVSMVRARGQNLKFI
jgi:hypothetical protein